MSIVSACSSAERLTCIPISETLDIRFGQKTCDMQAISRRLSATPLKSTCIARLFVRIYRERMTQKHLSRLPIGVRALSNSHSNRTLTPFLSRRVHFLRFPSPSCLSLVDFVCACERQMYMWEGKEVLMYVRQRRLPHIWLPFYSFFFSISFRLFLKASCIQLSSIA
jgi:hypothetical protein